MAPLDFKHMTSAKYRPGEDDAVNYYAQKRKKQYHGNEGKEVKELSMKPDKKLPNLKVPVKGKKGVSKFMRKKLITKAKDDLNASVQSADRKPEKYIKPDGKVGIRMVKVDKEVIKKEALNKDDNPFVKKLIGKLRKGSKTHAKQADDLEKAMKTESVDEASMSPMNLKRAEKFMGPSKNFNQAVNLVSKGMKVSKQQAIKMVKKILGVNPKTNKIDEEAEVLDHGSLKKDFRGGKVHTITKDHKVNAEILGHESHPKNATPHKGKKGKIPILKMYDRDRKGTKSGTVTLKKGTHMVHDPSNDEMHGYHPKHGHFTVYHSNGGDSDLKHHKPGVHKIKEEVEVDEALNLQQRMKRSRLMKRFKTRIKIGRARARRKMANKKTLEKRAMRQARAAIAKKLTRGIPKAELTFARKQEIEKRLDKPALKNRIKRIAKRIFKDVRKKEVQRKKG